MSAEFFVKNKMENYNTNSRAYKLWKKFMTFLFSLSISPWLANGFSWKFQNENAIVKNVLISFETKLIWKNSQQVAGSSIHFCFKTCILFMAGIPGMLSLLTYVLSVAILHVIST